MKTSNHIIPKEKAEELVLKYLRLQEEGSANWFHKILAKQCAIIAVDEILESHFYILSGINPKILNYYNEVKQEIEKL